MGLGSFLKKAAGGVMGFQALVAKEKLQGFVGRGGNIQAGRELKKEAGRLTKRRESLDALLRDKLEETTERETAFRKQLGVEEERAQQVLAGQLKEQLSGIEAGADVAREQVGELQAEKGMLRSTFAAEKIEDVTLTEMKEKGMAKIRAGEASRQIEESKVETLRELDRQKEALEFEFQAAEREQIQVLLQNLDETILQQQFAAAKHNQAMSAAGKNAMKNIIGNMVKQGATIAGASCWVARAVYGESNPQWLLVRHYVLNLSPVWFRWVYLRTGEYLSHFVYRSRLLKILLTPIFNRMARVAVFSEIERRENHGNENT